MGQHTSFALLELQIDSAELFHLHECLAYRSAKTIGKLRAYFGLCCCVSSQLSSVEGLLGVRRGRGAETLFLTQARSKSPGN
jgi:hypothetical protein